VLLDATVYTVQDNFTLPKIPLGYMDTRLTTARAIST